MIDSGHQWNFKGSELRKAMHKIIAQLSRADKSWRMFKPIDTKHTETKYVSLKKFLHNKVYAMTKMSIKKASDTISESSSS